jgi:hypothetical protein
MALPRESNAGPRLARLQRRRERDVVERGDVRLVADLLAGLPAVEHVGEAEEAPHHARFGMLGGTAEEVVVVEIEIDDVAVAVDRDAGNVVAEIAIPVDAKPARIGHHLAAVACRRVRHLLPIDLARPQRIGAERAALVAVPEPDDQLHQEIKIDPVALLDRVMAELGGILGDVDADVDEVPSCRFQLSIKCRIPAAPAAIAPTPASVRSPPACSPRRRPQRWWQ